MVVHRSWDAKIMLTHVCCGHGLTCQPAPLCGQAPIVTRTLVINAVFIRKLHDGDLPTAFLFNHLT